MPSETITIKLPDGWRSQLHAYSKANNNTVQRQVVELIRKAIRPKSTWPTWEQMRAELPQDVQDHLDEKRAAQEALK